ncbi:hypothetical protein SDC9_90665 [bioreactor metagenome]|uniref:Uncharacterized protein n=1 Tax=bioreactor metagenome TaxID=1076179 RepID=A0A644ZTA1_9ZZZZ
MVRLFPRYGEDVLHASLVGPLKAVWDSGVLGVKVHEPRQHRTVGAVALVSVGKGAEEHDFSLGDRLSQKSSRNSGKAQRAGRVGA